MKWFWGLILILFGVLLLGENFNWWNNLDWSAIWQYWPVLFVFIGLSILFRPFRWGWLVMLLLVLLVLVAVIDSVTQNPVLPWNEKIESNQTGGVFNEALPSGIDQVTLEIKTGAANLELKNSSEKLVEGTYGEGFGGLSLKSDVNNNRASIKLNTDEQQMRARRWEKRDLTVLVTDKYPVDLSLDTGASKMNLDLRELIISKLTVKTGASQLDVNIGSKIQKDAAVKISAGASSISVKLPADIGTDLRISSGLTSRDLSDFSEVESNHYQSQNYATATTKISLEIEAGVSSIKVGY